MVLGGCALPDWTVARRLRAAARRTTALAFTTLGIALVSVGSASAAARLPPVQITYSGTMSIEVFPTPGKPADSKQTIGWNATAGSAGSDGALALDFSSVSGSSSIEGNGDCYDSTSKLSLAAAKNPVAGGWNLNESSDYPSSGWKYIAPGTPSFIPVLEAYMGKCASDEHEDLRQTNELLLTQETFSPAQTKEFEALFDPLEFLPGKPAARTRKFSFDGISHCTCLPHETHVTESMTATVSATSPAAGNNITTHPAAGGGGAPSPKSTPRGQKISEARRRQLKEQAHDDLGPALERAWALHGVTLAPALTSGLTFSDVLVELGNDGLLDGGDEATARVIDDYRIINDPPDRHFHRLATPRAPRPPKLASCARAPAAEKTKCASLRGGEIAMLSAGARADAITEALLVTMNRDSTAIRAHDYASAQRQYVHFESLHSALHRELRSQGASGAQVAAILRSGNLSGVLSTTQSATAISSIEAKLSRAGVSPAKLGSLATHALEARETDALEVLAARSG